MATSKVPTLAASNELEKGVRERYMVEDVKAKVQVDRISKELKVIIDFFSFLEIIILYSGVLYDKYM